MMRSLVSMLAAQALTAHALQAGAAGRRSTRLASASFMASVAYATGTVEYTLDDAVISSALEPLDNYLLIECSSVVDSTRGGVLLPDQAKEKPTEGLVV